MALLPRCIGRIRDGSQCERRVKDAENPQAPLCHLHRANPRLSPIIPPADEVDEIKLLRRLAHDRDAKVRLRAVDLLIRSRERAEKNDEQCPRCASRAESADFVNRMTAEQNAEAYELFKRWKAIKAAALTQPLQGEADHV